LKLGCQQKPIRREWLEYTVATFIQDFFLQPDALLGLLKKASRANADAWEKQKGAVDNARKELKRLNKENERLLKFGVTGQFPEEQVQSEARRINAEIADWNAIVRQAKMEMSETSDRDENAVAQGIASVFEAFPFLQSADRKTLLLKFVSAVFVENSAVTRVILRLPAQFGKLSSRTSTDSQFRDSMDIRVEPDVPLKVRAELNLNKFGTLLKEKYRPMDVAQILGITSKAFQKLSSLGKYPKIGDDSNGRRFYSIENIETLATVHCPDKAEIALKRTEIAQERFRKWIITVGEIRCACGCGRALKVTVDHYYHKRLPKFIRGHSLRFPQKAHHATG
jgi:hypothetical protein